MTHRTAVIGGGISGLASAWRIAGLGHEVTLFESDEALGGLGGTFVARGICLEKFYHCILPSDRALLSLISSLGLDQDVLWKNAGLGFLYRGELFPLNGPKDLLRFSPLTPLERLRTALMGLRTRVSGLSPRLDRITAEEWLRRSVGDRAFEILWKPLLMAKIGEEYRGLPALWLSSRLHREKSAPTEIKGCLAGGYRSLIDAFERSLLEHGVLVRTRARIESVAPSQHSVAVTHADGTEQLFDTVVAAVPVPEFLRLVRGPLPPALRAASGLDHQGVVSGVFLTEEPLPPFYWMPFVDCGATAQGAVAMTHLVPLQRTGGLHVSYLMNYVHRDDPFFSRSDEDVLRLYEQDLERLFPALRGHIVEKRVFRAPYVEPIWRLGAAQTRPPASVVPERLYLVCTAQLYPRVNSWNSCCEMVEEMLPLYARETGAALPSSVEARA